MSNILKQQSNTENTFNKTNKKKGMSRESMLKGLSQTQRREKQKMLFDHK